MTSIAIPRRTIRRLEDFHTVGGGYDKETQRQSHPRKASGGPCDNPTVTRRQYLLDARFGVILAGDRECWSVWLTALQDPVWGVWFGRKSCIPAAPIYCAALFDEESEARQALVGDRLTSNSPPSPRVDVSRMARIRSATSRSALAQHHSAAPKAAQFAARPHRCQSRVSPDHDPAQVIVIMPIFEQPPLETLTPAEDRWTPIYLEHGRLEVDDSSVKWIGADRAGVPAAGGHAFRRVAWAGHDGHPRCHESLRGFQYAGLLDRRGCACGSTPSASRPTTTTHAAPSRRVVGRQEETRRDRPTDVHAAVPGCGRAGAFRRRVARHGRTAGARRKYAELGQQYGVTWKGRDYDQVQLEYGRRHQPARSRPPTPACTRCARAVCLLARLPAVHSASSTTRGTLPFIYDVADLYKEISSMPAAFQAIRQEPDDKGELTRTLLKERIEQEKLLQRMPKDLEELIQ